MKTAQKFQKSNRISSIAVVRDNNQYKIGIALLTALMIFGSLLVFAGNSKTDGKTMNTKVSTHSPDGHKAQTKESQAKITPMKAVEMLKEGNKRFVDNIMKDTDYLAQVAQTSTGQYPFASVVSCIDSRIPTEIVFDQGVGDIFNARIAGNFVNTDILGSLEFASKVAGAKAIVVMGHTSCGAVKGAADDVKLGNLTAMLTQLEPAVKASSDVIGEKNSKNAKYVQTIADKNVELTIEKIKKDSPVLREMYENGEITIVGAMYDVGSGKVTFFN